VQLWLQAAYCEDLVTSVVVRASDPDSDPDAVALLAHLRDLDDRSEPGELLPRELLTDREQNRTR
jgi:hypothetical protein